MYVGVKRNSVVLGLYRWTKGNWSKNDYVRQLLSEKGMSYTNIYGEVYTPICGKLQKVTSQHVKDDQYQVVITIAARQAA